MKYLLLTLAVLCISQCIAADGTDVTTKDQCVDFLSKETCDSLNKAVTFLKEKKTTLQDAIKEAVKNHITNAKELLVFVKEYIAKSFNCSTSLPQVVCDKLTEYAKNAKLSVLQVKLAIENAVIAGKTKVTDILNFVVTTLKTEITCENFLGKESCDSLRKALEKLGQQPRLLKEALWQVAQKHITKASEILTAVRETLTQLITNFTCEAVLPENQCTKLRDIAKALHLKTQQLRAAIEDAIFLGASTATAIFDQTITVLKTIVSCKAILGDAACETLNKIRSDLHENVGLVTDAIVEAVLHNVNRTANIIKYVKDTMVQKVKDFKCTYVLAQSQCDFIKKVAVRFKIRATDLQNTIIEAVVNGTLSVQQIYRVTLGALIAEAKDITCEDLAGNFVCGTLKALANNLGIKVSQVTLAVKEAIVNGKNTAAAILTFAKEFLLETASCDNFLGDTICGVIEGLARRFNIKFQEVINKIKELYSNGVTKVKDLAKDITSWIWNKFMGFVDKRDLDGSRVKKVFETIYKKIAEVVKDLKETDLSQAKEKAKDILEKMKSFTKEKLEQIKSMLSNILKGKDVVDKQVDVTYDLINDITEKEVREVVGY